MFELIIEPGSNNFGAPAPRPSPARDRPGLFAGLMMLVTLRSCSCPLVGLHGGISLEREKQTLDLLVTTPISLALDRRRQAALRADLRLPPDRRVDAADRRRLRVRWRRPRRRAPWLHRPARHRVRAWAFGLFCSSLVKRTQAATAITMFGVMAMTLGSVFILLFWQAMSSFGNNGTAAPDRSGIRPPQSWPTSTRSWHRPTSCAAPRRPSARWCTSMSRLRASYGRGRLPRGRRRPASQGVAGPRSRARRVGGIDGKASSVVVADPALRRPHRSRSAAQPFGVHVTPSGHGASSPGSSCPSCSSSSQSSSSRRPAAGVRSRAAVSRRTTGCPSVRASRHPRAAPRRQRRSSRPIPLGPERAARPDARRDPGHRSRRIAAGCGSAGSSGGRGSPWRPSRCRARPVDDRARSADRVWRRSSARRSR